MRGIDSSFVSNGLRRAFGPCCALKLIDNGVVLMFGLAAAILARCCFCRRARLKSEFFNGNGGVFDVDAVGLVAGAAGLLVPNALYRLFRYEE